MSTDVLSDYIDELLAGRAAPIQEYLLRHPEQEEMLARLLATALLAKQAIDGIEIDPDGEAKSKDRAVEELERVAGTEGEPPPGAVARARALLRRLRRGS
jgi:hypothetical protein